MSIISLVLSSVLLYTVTRGNSLPVTLHKGHSSHPDSQPDYEQLHRNLSNTLSQMSKQVADLTIKVSELQKAKETLEGKVATLESEMDCIMGRSDSCMPSKCLNGGTLNTDETCLCKPGYTGAYCEKDLDECEVDNPCRNQGKCENTYGGYKCECPFDYHGENCQHQYDDCSPNPCLNGVCVSFARLSAGVPHFQCYCNSGWKLSEKNYTCSEDIDECADMYDYCDSLAESCVNTVGSYSCKCPEGFIGNGKIIEDGCIESMTCLDEPCRNGKCSDHSEGFQCECTEGWSGTFCDIEYISWCINSPCLNEGICRDDDVTQFKCECQSGYKGNFCETIDLCGSVNCKNNGTCVATDDISYTCKCKPGYGGEHCEGLISTCQNNPCYNGGECVPNASTEGFHCLCDNNYMGKLCQDEVIYDLTTCGREGPLGPDQIDCETAYGNEVDVKVNRGIQNVYLDTGGSYRIIASGASGGSAAHYGQHGGYPAETSAVFQLDPGYLKIAVGQVGKCYRFEDLIGKKSKSVVCGGGGGSYVISNDTPLIITGGGGGAGDNGPGINASTNLAGTEHQPNNGVTGGALGDGGKSCSGFGGAGGAGFITAGEDGSTKGKKIPGTGGKPWPDLTGGLGNRQVKSHGWTAYGGFGGGGRGTWCPGGGGGYSGGAGKCSKTGKGTAHKGGGGGGSFTSSKAFETDSKISYNHGSGFVKIILLKPVGIE